MKEIIKENKYVEISYEKEIKLGMIKWKSKIIPSEEYRGAFNILIDYGDKNKGTERRVAYFLSDTTIQGVVSPADRKWFQEDAVPRAIATGLSKGAVVMSASVFKKYYINLILKTIKTFDMPFKIFSDYDTAISWLTSTGEHLE